MKFEDKLVDLRKKNNLSQEQLAEKLNVSRQTISKWELGQSKPDIDILINMSKLYDVNIDELVGSNKNANNRNEKKNNKFILYITIGLLTFCTIFLGYRLFNVNNESSFINKVVDYYDSKKAKSFNLLFSNDTGKRSSLLVSRTLADVIDSNASNKKHKIEVVFDNVSYGNDASKINEISGKLNSNKKYSVQFEYDDDGYIIKLIIVSLGSDVTATVFNSNFDFYTGVIMQSFLISALNNAVSVNTKYDDHLVSVVYNSNDIGSNINDIGALKTQITNEGDTFTKYNVSYDYDDAGYICKMIIENR